MFIRESNDWLVVAIDQWGNLDRMFAATAKYGDTTAFVGLVSKFEIGQEIPLDTWFVKDKEFILRKDRFPGIPGTNEMEHAYA